MELTIAFWNKINDLDDAFSDVETLSRVLELYDNENTETEYNDKLILINLLFEKVLVMRNCLDNFNCFCEVSFCKATK